MATTDKKTYVGSGKVHVFADGGEMLKFSFTDKDLDTMRTALDNGWVRLCISKRRSPSEKGQTHCAYIDTWKPRDRAEARPDEARASVEDMREPKQATEVSDSLPF